MKVEKCLYCSSEKLKVVSSRLDQKNILQCDNCGLLTVDTIDKNPQSIYNKEYFNKSTDTGVGYTSYLDNPAGSLIGKYGFASLFTKEPDTHLDLGCADGSLVEIFSSEGIASKGLDISKEAVIIAKNKGLDVEVSNLETFPAGYQKADIVTAFDVLEHSNNPGAVLKQVKKALGNDGIFVFSTLAVTSIEPTEYWFTHSLEHYVYYTHENLERILADIFGKDNFAFTMIEVNGVTEFWGIAKSKSVTKLELEVLTHISKKTATKKHSFYYSLFYNQVSLHEVAHEVIEKYGSGWSTADLIQARFFNYFSQGKLELAVNSVKEELGAVSATKTVFWQALAFAQEQLSELQKQTILQESSDQILELRGQLFRTRDDLHNLRNSRVVGRIIKARDAIGDNVPKVYKLPRRAAQAVKVKVAESLPDSIRTPIRRAIRHDWRGYLLQDKVVVNKEWDKSLPLVSIVIPFYNLGDTIEETLTSLTNQTFRNFEAIIINDGSPDKESVKKLKSIETAGYNAKFIYQENQGVAATRNNGIKLAKGKYIVCLDSDDVLEPTYLEKAVTVLETNPDAAIVTSYMTIFGVMTEVFEHVAFDPIGLYKNNMIITAAMFTKKAWETVGGYKSKIGYEDWEFWINLVEHGFWAKQITEPLFRYRTSMQSRYVEDKDIHWKNLKVIRSLHPNYKNNIKKLLKKRQNVRRIIDPASALVNLPDSRAVIPPAKANVLITIPWMTFGGAETLIYNFCREVKSDYNITFVTGLASANEWEYKFKEISENIYHLPNLFDTETLYLDYISHQITQKDIDTIHIIHNGFTFDMLQELKARHPRLRVILTLFNDRAAYFDQSLGFESYIDIYTSDNAAVINHFKKELKTPKDLRVIPNGINCVDEFNPDQHNRKAMRAELNLSKDDVAVYYVGRLSEEKNPNVFLDAAERIIKDPAADKNIKFLMIGDGGMKKDIEEQIESIASDRIQYLGYQSAIAHYLSAADVFVLPSSIEGFPLSILEAMAMKVVVVASDVGAVADVVTSEVDGFVVTPGSDKEIAAAIKVLASDRTLLEKMKDLSRNKVETLYSNPVLGKNYRLLYGEKK